MSDAIEHHAWPPRVGGQHVTRTETGVLAIHKPTGIAIACDSERSQLGNKLKATMRLEQMLEPMEAKLELGRVAEDVRTIREMVDAGDLVEAGRLVRMLATRLGSL